MLRCFGASGSPHISSAGISVRNHPQAQPQVLPLMRTLLPLGPQHPWRRVFQVGWANVQWPLHVIRNIYVIRHETPPVVSCTRTSCYAGDVWDVDSCTHTSCYATYVCCCQIDHDSVNHSKGQFAKWVKHRQSRININTGLIGQLVGGLENCLFFHIYMYTYIYIGNVIILTDFHIFQDG